MWLPMKPAPPVTIAVFVTQRQLIFRLDLLHGANVIVPVVSLSLDGNKPVAERPRTRSRTASSMVALGPVAFSVRADLV